MAKWEPGLVGARKTNELNVSWQGFTALIPEIFEFKNLISLRLVGNTLPTLPEELFTGLPKLQVLFLTANHLTALPENIGKCITLRELNIMKNDVQVLPDSICDLVNIESLEMSNNKLTTLPKRFGNLVCSYLYIQLWLSTFHFAAHLLLWIDFFNFI
jgi:leucine-rich repeat protein SHOC2